MRAEQYPEFDAAALRDLHLQNCWTALLFPVVWLFLVAAAELLHLAPTFVIVNSVALLIGLSIRLVAIWGWRRHQPQNRHHWVATTFGAAMVVGALHYSGMTTWALLDPGLAILRQPLVVGAFIGAAMALLAMPPESRLRLAFATVTTVPPMTAMVATEELAWLLTAGIGAAALARISLAARRQQRRLREAVTTAELLRERTAELEHLSSTDPMTQLRNRSHFDVHYELEWRRAHRQQYPLALLMLDLDRFKSINDRYGHLFGDQVLAAVAATLRASHQRSGDLLARLGGEEFGLLLINTDLEQARQVAERICHAVAQIPLDYEGQPVRITISIGVAAGIPETPFGDAAQAFFHGADLALYRAKREGRNRVCTTNEAELTARSPDTAGLS
jgi:diguanylate cyclase (GGDEF)-like protein